MSLNENELSQVIHNALTQKTDGYGNPTQISEQTKNYSAGLIAALKAAIVTNAPGTITGVTSPAAPLSGGTGIGGVIAITPAPMIARSAVGIFTQGLPDLTKENTALIQYIGTGLVTFASGNITGNCTNTADNPGPLINGAGVNGKIVGLTGIGATVAVTAVLGFTGPHRINHYQVVISYILEKAAVTYASGSVTGVCPAGGGALITGTGINGTIS